MQTYKQQYVEAYLRQQRMKIVRDVIILILAGLFLLFICFFEPIMKATNTQTYVVTVQSKERVTLNQNRSKYLVYSIDDAGNSMVFEVTDSLLRLRFDSADTYNLIAIGGKYEFTTGGYRVPPLSMYPNIYEIKLLNQEG